MEVNAPFEGFAASEASRVGSDGEILLFPFVFRYDTEYKQMHILMIWLLLLLLSSSSFFC